MHTFFFGQPNWQARLVKKITVFYYGEGDAQEATRLASAERASQNLAMTRDASAFDGELEQCTEVVILPNVAGQHRAKIEGAYGGDLIKLRGSSKWYGGEVKTDPHGPDAQTSVVIPDSVTIHGPKAKPEEVSGAARPDSNMGTVAPVEQGSRPTDKERELGLAHPLDIAQPINPRRGARLR